MTPAEQEVLKPNERLLVISNRLPVTLSRGDAGWEAKASSGGLASAMEPILKQTGGLWLGWAGDDGELDPATRQNLLAGFAEGFSYVPVEFPPGAGEAFYKGYPNQTVWPLFHVFPSRMNFDPQGWRDYVAGNEYFAATTEANRRDGDLIWIHDYHLMLLPQMLRDRVPGVRLGFFLHIPFPSSEVFSLLPRGDEVLLGLLGADLISFHTHLHLQNFRSCLTRILGIESSMDRVEYEGRIIRLEALPIGIDPRGLVSLLEGDPPTKERIEELRSQYADMHVIAAVDRLDYTKGVPERLNALRGLLRQNPELKEKLVMIQVAVPSREGIGEYQNLSSEINELVGEINGEFGTAQWNPIMFIRQSIDRSRLAAIYAVADVAWVTPLRDGMNLVAKEYCACKLQGDGVLVLSQFAGAAAEMGEALLVNPYDQERVIAAVERALNMPDNERRRRMRHLRDRVSHNDVFDWAAQFLKSLAATGQARSSGGEPLDFRAAGNAYRSAARRLLILDYDGTLVPIQENPANAGPTTRLLRMLSQLAADRRNLVAVVTGRRVSEVEEWLGGVPGLYLAAEHGAFFRRPASQEWEHLVPAQSNMEWKARIRSVFDHFVRRAPASFVEEKEYSIVWHYRRVEPDFGKWLAAELNGLIEGLLAETDARPFTGRGIVEVRPVWVNKGMFTSDLLAGGEAEFQLAAGDDVTDEEIFDRLSDKAWTIHVGTGHSRAKYRLKDQSALVRLLESLAEATEPRAAA